MFKIYLVASYRLAMIFFNDPTKALAWLKTPNPELGGVSPDRMIALGRGKKLMKFMKDRIDTDTE